MQNCREWGGWGCGLPSTASAHGSIIGAVTRCLLPLLAALALLAPATASAEDDFYEPIALGMGGTGRVLPFDLSSLHLNASALGVRAQYIGGFSYGYAPRERSHQISTSAADSRTGDYFLGVKYSTRIYEPPFDPSVDLNWYPLATADELVDKRTVHRFDIAGGYAFFGRRLSIGATARILRQEFDIRENRNKFTLDAGVTVAPTRFLVFAVSAQNMIPTRDTRYPTRFSGGFALDFANEGQGAFGFRGEADVVFDFTSQETPRTDFHGGGEFRFLYLAAIRAGYYSDRQFKDNYVTWGVGFVTDRFRLNFGMRIEVGPLEKRLRSDIEIEDQRVGWNLGFDLRF